MSVDSNGETPYPGARPEATGYPSPPYPSPPYSAPPGQMPPPLPPNGGSPIPAQGGGAEPVSAIPYATRQPRYPASEPEPTPIPRPDLIASNQVPSIRIGLWGGSRAGKSTYLAALPIAGMQTTDPNGRWIVGGVGQEAVDYLVKGVDLLAKQRTFPPATLLEESLTWVFQGPPPADRPKFFSRSADRGVEFALQLQDASGEAVRTGTLVDDVIDHFVASQGLVYLFDPILDAEQRLQSFDFFYATLQTVYARVRAAGGLVRNRLPHHVAVCVTKFDDPEIFDPAARAGWVAQQPTGSRLPVVPPNQSRAFFEWVCRGYRGGTATMVADALQSFFHHDRVHYYATSAIGFRLNRNMVFDFNDYRNIEALNGVPRIRTVPRPFNVLEPLIDLERRISGKKR
jgi:hypothetical protein